MFESLSVQVVALSVLHGSFGVFQPRAVCLMALFLSSYGTSRVSKYLCQCRLRPVGHAGYLWQPQQGQEYCISFAQFKDTIKGAVALKIKRQLQFSVPHLI